MKQTAIEPNYDKLFLLRKAYTKAMNQTRFLDEELKRIGARVTVISADSPPDEYLMAVQVCALRETEDLRNHLKQMCFICREAFGIVDDPGA